MTLLVLVSAASALGGSCTCSDRQVEEQSDLQPACLWLISPAVFLTDGSTRLIQDEEHNRNPTVCLCLTEAEYESLGERLSRVGWPAEGTTLEEFNELAYDECKRLAALVQDTVDDECLDYYEAGTWLKDIYFARDDWENGAPPGFSCAP